MDNSFVRRLSGDRRLSAGGRVVAVFVCVLEMGEVDFGGQSDGGDVVVVGVKETTEFFAFVVVRVPILKYDLGALVWCVEASVCCVVSWWTCGRRLGVVVWRGRSYG